jgi:hypothetical protein
MIGQIYNNEKLAYEGDGFWTPFNDGKPPQYWCVLHEFEDMVLLVPVVFDVVDNLPLEEGDLVRLSPYQVSHWAGNLTLLLGFGVRRMKEELVSLPAFQLNSEIAKDAYKRLAKWARGKS